MENKSSFSYESFVSSNVGSTVSHFDYLQTIYQYHGLSGDLAFSFFKLFWPEYLLVDGLIFVSECFDKKYYERLLFEKKNSKEIQFWVNLIEVTGIFKEMSDEDAVKLASYLVVVWNKKLNFEFPDLSVQARYIFDQETREVFLTID